MIDNFVNIQNSQLAKLKMQINSVKIQKSEILSKEDEALKEQTDAFEAFLIKEVFDVALKKENTLFGKDASDEIYSSMYNDTMSRALSGGLGFSQMLFDYLRQKA